MKSNPSNLVAIKYDGSERTRIQWEILREVMQPRALDEKKVADLKAKVAPRGEAGQRQ